MWLVTDVHLAAIKSLSALGVELATQYMWLVMDLFHWCSNSQSFFIPAALTFFVTPEVLQKEYKEYKKNLTHCHKKIKASLQRYHSNIKIL